MYTYTAENKKFWVGFIHEEDDKNILVDLNYICGQLGLVTSGVMDDPESYQGHPRYRLQILTDVENVSNIRWLHKKIEEQFRKS